MDEFAHTNIVGGDQRHATEKRWQDVQEVLDAGIDVYTTVNVQHLESLSDVVMQITGVRQQETLPDRMFNEADEIKLVDLPYRVSPKPPEFLEVRRTPTNLSAREGV